VTKEDTHEKILRNTRNISMQFLGLLLQRFRILKKKRKKKVRKNLRSHRSRKIKLLSPSQRRLRRRKHNLRNDLSFSYQMIDFLLQVKFSLMDDNNLID